MLAPIAALAALLSDPHPVSRELLSTVTVSGRCENVCPRGNVTLGAGEIIEHRPDGSLLVLTARHVIENAAPSVYVRDDAEPGIRFNSFARERSARRTRVLAYASNVDLALVAFLPDDDDEYAVAPLGGDEPSALPNSGYVVGDPNGALWTVSQFTLLEKAPGTFLLDCATCGPGDSGGGVFDSEGSLLGILVQQRVESDDVSSIPTNEFQAVSLAELRLFLCASESECAHRGAPPQSQAWIRFDAARRKRG